MVGEKYFFEYYVPTVNRFQSAKQASKFFPSEAAAVADAVRRKNEGKIINATLLVLIGNQVRYVR